MAVDDKNVLQIGEHQVSYEPGQSVLEAALTGGIPFCSECGGKARCSTCRIFITDGDLNITPVNEAEKQLKKRITLPAQSRLACQAFLKGGAVRVNRIMKDETDYPLYLPNQQNGQEAMGREMHMALLFLDIRDFTHFVETHLAFDVVHLVRKLFSTFENIINRYNGKVIETAGDGLYAAFGFTTQLQQAANDAVKAGFVILDELVHLNRDYLIKHFDEEIAIGLGLHVGKVAVGKIHLDNKDHEIVMGYPVNIAARLEGLTKELNNSFIISENTYKLLQNPPQVNGIRDMLLKGVTTEQKVYLIGKAYS